MTENITAKIDWITATRPIKDAEMLYLDEGYSNWAFHLAESVMSELNADGYELALVKNVGRGYAATIEVVGVGIKILCPPPHRLNQGVGIQATGDLRDISHWQLARALLIKDWKFTRLDLAIDWQWGELSWEQCIESYLGASMAHDRWATSIYRGARGGTLGVGSRQSNIYTRVYDKNAEQGLANPENWIRIEFEIKGKLCAKMGRDIINRPQASAAALLEKRDFQCVTWGARLLSKLAKSHPVTVPVLGRKETDTERWLKHEVANALIGLARRDPEGALDVVEYLKNAVTAVLKLEKG